MTDEVEVEDVEQIDVEEDVQEPASWATPEYLAEKEEEAKRHGWKPEGVEGKEPIDPITFLARHEAIVTTRKQKENHERDLKEIKKTVRELAIAREREGYERAKAELEALHRRAVDEGDHTKAKEAVERMSTLQAPPDPQADLQRKNQEAITDFINRNKFHAADSGWQQRAEQLYSQRMQELGMTPGQDDATEILPWVEQELTRQQTSRVTTPSVEAPKPKAKKRKRHTAADITDEATLRQGWSFVKQGLYKSLDEFAQDLFAED